MKIILHKSFEKQYKKLGEHVKQQFKERRNTFLNDPFDLALNNHPLKGNYKGYRSIYINADVRALYKLIASDIALFVVIDSHSNLYS